MDLAGSFVPDIHFSISLPSLPQEKMRRAGGLFLKMLPRHKRVPQSTVIFETSLFGRISFPLKNCLKRVPIAPRGRRGGCAPKERGMWYRTEMLSNSKFS